MARPAIEIVSDAKRKIDKERQRGDFRPTPYFDAQAAAEICDPTNYGGNNKSEWIKKLATAAAHILCEIETIQAIKGMAFTNVDKFPDGTQTVRDSSYFENSLTLQKQLSYGK